MAVPRQNPDMVGQVANSRREVTELRNTAFARIAQKGGRIIDAVNRFTDVTTTATSFSGATTVLSSGTMRLHEGRGYYIYCPAIGMYLDGTVNGIMAAQITYTTDGSAPGPGDDLLCESDIIVATNDFVSTTTLGATWFPSSTHDMRTLLSIWREHTGGGSTRGVAWGFPGIELTCFDMGAEVT